MSWRPWDGGTFGIGLHADGVQFWSSDVHGRLVDAGAELPTARDERVRQLQALRDAAGYRDAPSASPAAIINELRAADPAGYGAGLAAGLAEGRYPLPVCVIESPGRPADMSALARLRR
jgi:hypothetical protein